MTPSKGYAALRANTPLVPFTFERRSPQPRDIEIDIAYCGICHSDLHQARDEWGDSRFPMVPGHEIVGIVKRVGSEVTNFKQGDKVGVGCFVNSCRSCASCNEGEEAYCENKVVSTYNDVELDGVTPTYGGYSNNIVVDEHFVVRIPQNLELASTAPLLCAGITTYSPLRHWKVTKGTRVAVVGLGGLGHMAVKLASAMGAEVTVLSHSSSKRSDAIRFGASEFFETSAPGALKRLERRYDLILNTVSAQLPLSDYLKTLRRDGTLVMLGIPEGKLSLDSFPLILGRRRLAGSLVGGMRETQEMLDFCGRQNINCEIETIPIQAVNEAYERILKSDVKYRFVIDLKTL